MFLKKLGFFLTCGRLGFFFFNEYLSGMKLRKMMVVRGRKKMKELEFVEMYEVWRKKMMMEVEEVKVEDEKDEVGR